MSRDDEILAGLLDGDQIENMTEASWRKILLRYMISMEKRVRDLEEKASWKAVLTSIPWALIGGLVGYCLK